MPELSYREAVRDALSRAMRDDDDVFVMGEDIAEMGGSMGVTQGMLDEVGPERVRNTPISELALYGLKEDLPDELEPIPLGQARVHREGEDVTVIATGRLVHEALSAAKEAEQEGVSVEVVDPRTLQPLDEEALISSVKKTNRCVVAHEAVTRMGFGAELAAVIQYGAFDWLDAPIERVGAKFTPLPFAPVMEEWVVPHANDVLEAIRRTVGRDGN